MPSGRKRKVASKVVLVEPDAVVMENVNSNHLSDCERRSRSVRETANDNKSKSNKVKKARK